jgi:c(7)-type cytochrome triheme protein
MKLGGTAILLAVLTLASAPLAGEPSRMPRLPKGLILPQGEDSPGPVTFNHDSHVDQKKAHSTCQVCHPKPFPMLKSGALPKGAVTHEKMQKGQYCGKCHGKDKTAFDFEDGCENCHAQ